MTKWVDPITNPEQNARYWRERDRNDAILITCILVLFAAGFALIVWW